MATTSTTMTQAQALAAVIAACEEYADFIPAEALDIIKHMHGQKTQERPKSAASIRTQEKNTALAQAVILAMQEYTGAEPIDTGWVVDHVQGIDSSQKAVCIIRDYCKDAVIKTYNSKGKAIYQLA